MAKAKQKMCKSEWIAWVVVLIGALNWGLVGFFNFNLVTALLGTGLAATIVYDIVGISAVYACWLMTKYARMHK